MCLLTDFYYNILIQHNGMDHIKLITVTLLTSSCMSTVNFYSVQVFFAYNSEFLITSQLLTQFLTYTHPIISDDSGDDGSNFSFHASISLSAAGKLAALKAEPAFEPARQVRLT